MYFGKNHLVVQTFEFFEKRFDKEESRSVGLGGDLSVRRKRVEGKAIEQGDFGVNEDG